MSQATDVYYDPYDVEISADPYPVFRRLRDEAPLYYNEQHDFYAVSRADDVEPQHLPPVAAKCFLGIDSRRPGLDQCAVTHAHHQLVTQRRAQFAQPDQIFAVPTLFHVLSIQTPSRSLALPIRTRTLSAADVGRFFPT